MFSQSRDCAGASYNAASFHPMYYPHHPTAAQGGGYTDLALSYGGGGALQYPADGYWNNYRTVIGGYDEWHGQGFGGAAPLAASAHLAAQPGTPSPQQCPAAPGIAAGRNDSPDSGIVTGAADLPLPAGAGAGAGAGGLMTAGAAPAAPAAPELTPAVSAAYARPPQQQQQQPARDNWEWLDRNSYPTTARPPPGKTRTKDKYRVVYSDAQRLELEKEFRYNNYITIKRKLELSRILGLTDRQVKIWFQNRRAKERKQKRRMEETAKRQLIDLQQNGSTGGGTDMQIGINHSHLQGVHGLVPLHRQAAAGAAAGGGGGGGGSEAGRFPRYPMAAGHPMHPDMVSPQQPAQHQHQHHQQHQQHQQHQLVAKSEPHDGEPPAF